MVLPDVGSMAEAGMQDGSVHDRIAAGLARDGWSVSPGFPGDDAVRRLHAETMELHRGGRFRAAGVGPGATAQRIDDLRREEILWLWPPHTPDQGRFLAEMERLRVAVNRYTFLGLLELEAHLAVFPAGGFYGRHLDQFADDPDRVVTAILYLNPDWTPEKGGALRLYLDAEHVDVLPLGGTLVTFLSSRFPHEVLAPTEPRVGITGWFRRRGTGPVVGVH